MNIRDMLVTIYPQKWLPYRYLWPFLRNHLDSWRALEQISQNPSTSLPKIVILEAERDELVPKSHGDALEKRCIDLGLDVKRHVIRGAFAYRGYESSGRAYNCGRSHPGRRYYYGPFIGVAPKLGSPPCFLI
jgi:hypothetical protein